MRPGLSRHAGSGKNARKKNRPDAAPPTLSPFPSSNDSACAIAAASSTVVPSPQDGITKRSRPADSARNAARLSFMLETVKTMSRRSTVVRPSQRSVNSKRSPAAQPIFARKRPYTLDCSNCPLSRNRDGEWL